MSTSSSQREMTKNEKTQQKQNKESQKKAKSIVAKNWTFRSPIRISSEERLEQDEDGELHMNQVVELQGADSDVQGPMHKLEPKIYTSGHNRPSKDSVDCQETVQIGDNRLRMKNRIDVKTGTGPFTVNNLRVYGQDELVNEGGRVKMDKTGMSIDIRLNIGMENGRKRTVVCQCPNFELQKVFVDERRVWQTEENEQ